MPLYTIVLSAVAPHAGEGQILFLAAMSSAEDTIGMSARFGGHRMGAVVLIGCRLRGVL